MRCGSAIIGAIVAVVVTQLVAGGQIKPGSPAQGQRIGQFRMTTPGGGTFRMTTEPATKARNYLLQGKNNNRVVVTTARYDLSAPHITLQQANRKNVITTGTASGGVTVVVRDTEQTTTLTCERAVYTFATGNAPTRIDLTGKVKAITRTPGFTEEGPPVLTGESGFVEFLSDGRTVIQLESPEATGTPIEPPPAKKKP